MHRPKHRQDLRSAVTLIEVLIALGVVAILGGGAYVTVANSRVSADEAKLEQDVRVLNSAIDGYMASGGDLDGVSTPADVLARLKTRADSTSAPRVLGLTGSFVDQRTTPLMQTSEEAGTGALRAYYTTSPSPRFITGTSGSAGVKAFVFDDAAGAASPTGEERTRTLDVATQTAWVWDFTNRPAAAPGDAQVPVATEITNRVISPGLSAIQLNPPTFSPAAGVFPLTTYPLLLSLVNPNPAGSSRIYYSLNSGPYVLFNTPFSISPNTTITAFCISLDPSRYTTSAAATAAYGVTPLQLAISISASASLTYAQVGGSMLGQPAQIPPPATITLGVTVPPPYLSSDGFRIEYTTDGSDPLTSTNRVIGPSFSGSFLSPSIDLSLTNWGTRSNLPIRAVARALNTNLFISSPVMSNSVSASRVALAQPTVNPANQFVFNSVTVTMSNPATGPSTGMEIRYTTNGTTPTNTNTLYAGPFSYSGFAQDQVRTVTAATFAAGTLTNWFNQSPTVTRSYTGPNFTIGTNGGILIQGGNVANNAAIRGSVVVASVTNGTQPNITINNNASVTGDMFVPGTPNVTGLAAGKVTNLNGAVNPTNYTITFNNNSSITGRVFRRATPVYLPTVTVPTGLTNRPNQSSGTLLPGAYNTVNPGNNATITLGIAGATNPSQYVITNFSAANNVQINIVGPVILTITPSSPSATVSIQNNVVFGNSARPEWLQINMASGNFLLGNNGTLYGSVNAPANSPGGTVTFDNNTTFRGSVTARNFILNNNGAGIIFTRPPPL
jgi:prepilin-type N-terminal cleavage/methylation domain-containing protein